MDANIFAIFTYLISIVIGFIPGVRYVAWLAPLIFLFVEKQSNFVKFHAVQSFVLNLIGQILAFIFSVILTGIIYGSVAAGSLSGLLGGAGLLGLIALAISIIILIFAIISIIKAYGYIEYHIPFAAPINKIILPMVIK